MSKLVLTRLMRVATHLKKYDTEMNLTRLQVLLVVARGTEDGVLVKEIVRATGNNQSTVARTLAHLGEAVLRGQKLPLRWIDTRPDMEDPRRVRCFLTEKGRTVVNEIEELME